MEEYKIITHDENETIAVAQNIESEKSKESFSLIDSFLSAQNENFSESIEQLIFQTFFF